MINFERIDRFTPTSFDVYHAEYNKFPFYIIFDFFYKENFGNVLIESFIVLFDMKIFHGVHEGNTILNQHKFPLPCLAENWMVFILSTKYFQTILILF